MALLSKNLDSSFLSTQSLTPCPPGIYVQEIPPGGYQQDTDLETTSGGPLAFCLLGSTGPPLFLYFPVHLVSCVTTLWFIVFLFPTLEPQLIATGNRDFYLPETGF